MVARGPKEVPHDSIELQKTGDVAGVNSFLGGLEGCFWKQTCSKCSKESLRNQTLIMGRQECQDACQRALAHHKTCCNEQHQMFGFSEGAVL